MVQPATRLDAVMWREIFKRYKGSNRGLQNQIRTMMVDAILEGRLPGGSEVPSSRELADSLGVARNTVVLAYQQLASMGYLLSRERSGHRVNPEMTRSSEKPRTRVSSEPQKVVPLNDRMPHWEERLKRSVAGQRNITKRADWQKYAYPFLYGQFDPTLFPTAEWRECCMKALSVADIRHWAQDLILQDDESLIREICTKVLPRRGVWATPDEVVITVGAQNALFMIAHLFMGANTPVAIENPCYPDARNIFAMHTDRLIAVDVDEDGLPLADALGQCRYVYVTPSHQCPTTSKMPIDRREALLALAEKKDFVVIEDDYEAESSFSENPSPALKSMDKAGRVLYIGSLSKTFAPGLRLGYVVGPPSVVRELRGLRRLMIRHPAAFIQRAFALFISLGHLDAMMRRQTLTYRQRSGAIHEALGRHLPEFHAYPTQGGSSTWVRGPKGLDARKLSEAAERAGVLIECGDVFFQEPAPREFFRLGFSAINAEKIDAGIEALARVFRSDYRIS